MRDTSKSFVLVAAIVLLWLASLQPGHVRRHL